MTKNNNNTTPSNDGEFLDSSISTPTEESKNNNLENSQDNTLNQNIEVTDVSLDNNENKEITIPLVLSNPETSSENTSEQKYLVVINTDTKYVLDVNGNGQSYSHTTYSKSLNFKVGDFIIIPKEGE